MTEVSIQVREENQVVPEQLQKQVLNGVVYRFTGYKPGESSVPEAVQKGVHGSIFKNDGGISYTRAAVRLMVEQPESATRLCFSDADSVKSWEETVNTMKAALGDKIIGDPNEKEILALYYKEILSLKIPLKAPAPAPLELAPAPAPEPAPAPAPPEPAPPSVVVKDEVSPTGSSDPEIAKLDESLNKLREDADMVKTNENLLEPACADIAVKIIQKFAREQGFFTLPLNRSSEVSLLNDASKKYFDQIVEIESKKVSGTITPDEHAAQLAIILKQIKTQYEVIKLNEKKDKTQKIYQKVLSEIEVYPDGLKRKREPLPVYLENLFSERKTLEDSLTDILREVQQKEKALYEQSPEGIAENALITRINDARLRFVTTGETVPQELDEFWKMCKDPSRVNPLSEDLIETAEKILSSLATKEQRSKK